MNEDLLSLARTTLQIESQALLAAHDRLQESALAQIQKMFEWLQQSGGALIVSGVGKSGLVGQKIASTFNSLGQHAHFLHPNEALHGDLGRVRPQDVVLWISYSGTTEEILKLMPHISVPAERWMAIVGNTHSPIAKACAVALDGAVEKEACLNNLAPTTSTTLALALGDVLAVLFEKLVGLTKEKFALNHPAGLLGKSLSLKVANVMVPAQQCPRLQEQASFSEVILEMTKFPVMACAVVKGEDQLVGIIVEGDFRRALQKNSDTAALCAADLMNPQPITVGPEVLAFEALKLMEQRERQISVLPVVQEERFLGFVRVHDLLKEGFLPPQ